MVNNSGITYYSLVSNYSGDTTKNCSMSAGEIDGNFYFLRGNDIVSMDWDNAESVFVLTKLNGEQIKTDSIDEYLNASILKAISGLQETVITLQCSVSGMSESISGIFEEIDAKVAECFGKTTAITSALEAKIDKNTIDIKLLRNEMESNNEYINDLVNDKLAIVDEVKNYYKTLLEQLTALKQRVTANKSELNSKIKANTEKIKTAQDSIIEIQDKLVVLQNTIECHKIECDQNIKRLEGLYENLTVVYNNSITQINSSIQTHKSDVSREISRIDATIKSLHNKTTGLDAKEVKKTINNLKSLIDKLANDIRDEKILNVNQNNAINNQNIKINNIEEAYELLKKNIYEEIDKLKKAINDKTQTVTGSTIPTSIISDIEEIECRLTSVEDLIKALKTNINNLDTKINNVNNNLTNEINQIKAYLTNNTNVYNNFLDQIEGSLKKYIDDQIALVKKYIGNLPSGSAETNIVDYFSNLINVRINNIKSVLLITGNDVEL